MAVKIIGLLERANQVQERMAEAMVRWLEPEERKAMDEVSNTNEKLRYLLGYLEAAIDVVDDPDNPDPEARKVYVKLYQAVVNARCELRQAEQDAERFMGNVIVADCEIH